MTQEINTNENVQPVLYYDPALRPNKGLIHPLKVSKRNVSNFKQHKISQVAKDLEQFAGVNPSLTTKILMARGIPKLHNLKKSLISYSEVLKQVRKVFYRSRNNKTLIKPRKGSVPQEVRDYYRAVGYIEALEDISRDLQDMLMDSSFMPVNDKDFERFFNVPSMELIRQTRNRE